MKGQILKFLIVFAAMIPKISGAEEQSTMPKFGFIENKGQIKDQNQQANHQVKFLLNTPGLNLQLRSNGFSYDAFTYESDVTTLEELRKDNTKAAGTYKYHRVDITLVGANKDAILVTENSLPDYINYNTTAGETITAHHYSKVTYKNIYNGIDLEFITITNKPIEYNFIVHPGADASQIKMQYTGSDQVVLEGKSIAIALAHGMMHETIPASYILSTKAPVNVQYKALGNNTFAYETGAYDATKTLIIDPVPDIAWATYYGGSGDEVGKQMVVSGSSVYVAGFTNSTNSIATTGAFKTSISGSVDGFIVKMNTSGVRQWSTYFGGNNNDFIMGMGAGSNGDFCITGQTSSTSGLATSGVHQGFHAGGSDPNDGFIAMFSSAGSRLWATYYGGSGIEYITSAAIDGNGDIYVGGTTSSSTGISTTPSVQSSIAGNADAFLAKFNGSGVRQWATYAGGNTLDEGNSVAIDGLGNVFLCGITNNPSSTYLFSSGAHQTFYGGGTFDLFLAKYSTSNGARQWGTLYGGSGDEGRVEGRKLTADANGNVYMTGSTVSPNYIATTGSFQPNIHLGSEDGFIVKFSGNGVRQWGTYYGSSAGGDALTCITSDASGNLYVAGFTNSSTGLATTNAYRTFMSGTSDVFFAKFNSGGARQYSSYYGGATDEDVFTIGVDANEHVYLFGNTNSSTGISTTGAHQTSIGGNLDNFLARFNACTGVTLTATTAVTDATCFGQADGQVTVSPTNGLAPYTYRLSTSINGQVSGTFTGLAAGNYNIIITDDNGCTNSMPVTVSEPLPLQTPVITGATNSEISKTETYLTSQQTGITYQWTATGGSILNGQGTNQVQVTWANHGSGSVKVVVRSGTCADSGTIAPFVNWRTGVDDIDAANQVAIYPNPATDNIHISLQHAPQEGMIQLFDNVGNVVMQQTVQQQQTLNISHLPAGMYYLKVENKQYKISKL